MFLENLVKSFVKELDIGITDMLGTRYSTSSGHIYKKNCLFSKGWTETRPKCSYKTYGYSEVLTKIPVDKKVRLTCLINIAIKPNNEEEYLGIYTRNFLTPENISLSIWEVEDVERLYFYYNIEQVYHYNDTNNVSLELKTHKICDYPVS